MTEPEHAPRPLLAPADGIPDVVHTPAGLAEVVASMAAGTGPVAVDAERASGFRYGQRAYLVQLRRRGAGTALIDPIAVGDLADLSQALHGTEWVLHAASQDLPCLAELSFVPSSVFDTELAGRLLGLDRVGLGPIVESELGLQLAKEHSAADWSKRPLPESWLRYAALDVEVLLELRDALEAKLAATGKLPWAREEFEAVRLATPPGPRPEAWRRGAHLVRDARGLAVVRELWSVRERVAEAADIAPGRILSVDAMVAAALSKPRSLDKLASLREFTSRGAARRLRTWYGAVERALALPDSQLPPRRPPHDPAALPAPRVWRDREPEAAARLETVKAVVRGHAATLTMPQENLLSPDLQRRLAWQPPDPADEAGIGQFLSSLGARSWQVEQVSALLASGLADPDSVPPVDTVGSDTDT